MDTKDSPLESWFLVGFVLYSHRKEASNTIKGGKNRYVYAESSCTK